ncbi:MAG: ECF transporter S component [Clostridia bacterium]|nr:ECF transporter S component [Clostridia bacterium]
MKIENKNKALYSVKWLTVTAMLMALNIAFSSFGVPVPGGHFYLNDIVICTAALLLDPVAALMVGGVGSFLGDFFFYPTPMFVTLVVRTVQALAVSLIARNAVKGKKIVSASVAVAVGAVIMIVGYSLGRAFIYSTVEYAILKLPYQILQAVIGAVLSVLLCFKLGVGKAYEKMMKRK